MTLKPTDMLEIQSAIDEYERKFPRRPAPSAEVALAWRLGKKEWARRQAAQKDAQGSAPGVGSSGEETPDSVFAEQECSRLAWAWEQLRVRWLTWSPAEAAPNGSRCSLGNERIAGWLVGGGRGHGRLSLFLRRDGWRFQVNARQVLWRSGCALVLAGTLLGALYAQRPFRRISFGRIW